MIILHAGFLEGHFLLWGETPLAVTSSGKKPRLPKPAKGATTHPSPFDGGREGLRRCFDRVNLPVPIDKNRSGWVEIWLPTHADAPLASSGLIADPPPADAEVTVAPWTVTAFAMHPEETLQLLCISMGKEMLAPGIVVGDDLIFWGAALRLASSLVARERFLPGINKEGDELAARWIPCLTEIDAIHLRDLAIAMPAAARAFTFDSGHQPAPAPIHILDGFVKWMVDHLLHIATGRAARGIVRRKLTPQATIHDRWLHALRTAHSFLKAGKPELDAFAEQVRHWLMPVTITSNSPFRLCFRLDEPNDDRAPWRVTYLLRSVADPSLLVPVERAWHVGKRLAKSLFGNVEFDVRAYLLAALGDAARLDQTIEESLRYDAPSGFELDIEGALRFLMETACLLEENGFGILLPAWWSRAGTSSRLEIRAKVESPTWPGTRGISMDDLVQFQWDVALGGENITLEELRDLARMKSHLVRVRGQWILVDNREIQKAHKFLLQRQDGQVQVRDIVRLAIGAEDVSASIPMAGVTATGWIGDLLEKLVGNRPLDLPPPPTGFQGALRPYQLRGFAWLDFLVSIGFGACLADDMGLGKTIQALVLIARRWEAGNRQPVLLVCPTSVIGNWQREARRFTPELPVMVHHGTTRKRGDALREEVQNQAIVLSSYSLLPRDLDTLLEIPWYGIILDEAQNVKNPDTKQAQAARSLTAGFRIAMTGTPVENNVGDLWAIMEFLNKGLLGTQATFRDTFLLPIQAGRDPQATQRLKRITSPFILRRLKTDREIVPDLPEKMEMKVFCNLTREQASLYGAVVEEMTRQLKEATGIQRRGLILGTLSKLKQVCNHPAQFMKDNSPIPGRSGKVARLEEMLEEILGIREKALIFTQFATMGTLLKTHLEELFGHEVLFLHGAIRKKERDAMVDRFQAAAGGPSLFILSLKAGGTGLNLTQANHVFHFDRWWNPAVENQATDRAFRIGQMRNVQVHKFLCVGTLEEKIDDMIERKKNTAEEVIGAGENWITEMSTDQLQELFALRQEALGVEESPDVEAS
ncbi:MAG: DEAD/DEAH box helicase [Magnetococcales bacterium]|nr:DEAD/DEAH box helicase [Magnetococcales bacterium]